MFFRRVTALPCESLLVVRKGKLTKLGNGASALLFPGDSYAIVPTSTTEHTFQMQQESFDGITLRFKGIVIYRIVDVEIAASLFSFTAQSGVDKISQAIGDVCMGELRAIVARMTMDECVRERKQAITEKLNDAVVPVIEGFSDMRGWGIKIEVLQVAQVFCPDAELQGQLQADARDRIRKTAQFSAIETNREIHRSQMETESQLQRSRIQLEIEQSGRHNELEKVRIESRKESEIRKFDVEKELKLADLEAHRATEEKRITLESELRLFELEKQKEIAEKQLRLREIEARINSVDVEATALREKTLMEIRREILPIEQLPEISRNLSGLFRNSNLSLYGDQSMMLFNSVGELLSSMLAPMGKNGKKERSDTELAVNE